MVNAVEPARAGRSPTHSKTLFYTRQNQKNCSAVTLIISNIDSPWSFKKATDMAGSSAAQKPGTPHDPQVLRAMREAISEATLRPEPEALQELLAGLDPV